MKLNQGLPRAAGGDGCTNLAPVGRGENPCGAPTLLHIPQKPKGRDLVGLRSDIHIHKQSCKTLGSSATKTRKLVNLKTG